MAMSDENVEIVRRVFEAFNRGGHPAVESAGFLANEVVFDGTRAEIPGVGVLRGIDEVRTFFREEWFAAFPFEDWEIHIEEPIDNGDQVIVTSASKVGERAAKRGLRSHSEIFSLSATEGSCESRYSGGRRKPSKPLGCRSRRWRRRMWNWCPTLRMPGIAARPSFARTYGIRK